MHGLVIGYPPAMDIDALRRLHYAAAIACGVFAALAMHIVLTVFGVGLDTVLRNAAADNRQQLISALAWWAIGGAARTRIRLPAGTAISDRAGVCGRDRRRNYEQDRQSGRHPGRDRRTDGGGPRADLRLLRRQARL